VAEPGRNTVAAELNAPLTPGATVTTGADSRAIVENGLQRIVMSANSRMTLAADSTDAMTRVLQDLGALLFQVDRRGEQHFRVETPLLAAVVKGTTFTVSVTPGAHAVHVSQGLVEVRANNGGAANDVGPGMTARVAQGEPAVLSMTAPNDAAAEALDAAPGLDYAEASDGLVASPPDQANLGAASSGRAHGASRNGNANGSSGGSGNAVMGTVRSVVAWVTGNAGGNSNNQGNYRNNGNNGNNGTNGNNGNNPPPRPGRS
jgi:hypothetical protein